MVGFGMSDDLIDRLIKAMEKVSSCGNQLSKSEKLTVYDDFDLWEDRMKVYLESVDEGGRALTLLGQLDNEVYSVVREAAITPTHILPLRLELSRSPLPWVARAALKERRQHGVESVVDFQRHLRILAKQAYPEDSCAALENRILENFVDGIVNPDDKQVFLKWKPTPEAGETDDV
ncbi:hypothetical protein SprV_0301344600 [Sparganum proliferum]